MALRTAISNKVLRRRGSLVAGARSMSSWWQSVDPAPKDPILGVTEAYLADPSPDKVNVGVVRLTCSIFFSLCFSRENEDEDQEVLMKIQKIVIENEKLQKIVDQIRELCERFSFKAPDQSCSLIVRASEFQMIALLNYQFILAFSYQTDFFFFKFVKKLDS